MEITTDTLLQMFPRRAGVPGEALALTSAVPSGGASGAASGRKLRAGNGSRSRAAAEARGSGSDRPLGLRARVAALRRNSSSSELLGFAAGAVWLVAAVLA